MRCLRLGENVINHIEKNLRGQNMHFVRTQIGTDIIAMLHYF